MVVLGSFLGPSRVWGWVLTAEVAEGVRKYLRQMDKLTEMADLPVLPCQG